MAYTQPGFGMAKQYRVPSSQWVEKAFEETRCTPDLPLLESRAFWNIFVYGEDQPEHPRFDLIEDDAAFIAQGFTESKYSLWKRNLGEASWAMALDQEYKTYPPAEKRKIKGTIMVLSSSRYLELDKDKGNTIDCLRQRVKILVPYRILKKNWPNEYKESLMGRSLPDRETYLSERKIAKVEAWMYIGIQDHWDHFMENGHFSPVRHYKSRAEEIDTYYSFTQLEYDK
jgi:hypothetical protein